MRRPSSHPGRSSGRGFGDPGWAAQLIGSWSLPAETTTVLVDASRSAADPDLALSGVHRIVEARPDLLIEAAAHPGWVQRVTGVMGASVILNHRLAAHPDDILVLADPEVPHDARAIRERFALACQGPDPADRLRRAYGLELLRIAARDLTAADPFAAMDAVAAELSDLADATLEAALVIARAEVGNADDVRLAVVGLGKAGARELNYSSDVDVIFVAEPADRIEVATRLAETVTRVVSEPTVAGVIWPLDANLRPEGRYGALVRTLAAMDSYYQQWAENWEFQALLKARPMAGDHDLGSAFVEMVAPRVWRVGDNDQFVSGVQQMRRRVVSLIPARERDREIKLGAGGLRDTEFSVQLLQLVHGRADPRLRKPATMDALGALVSCGYVGRRDGTELDEEYRFQRVLEHRVQLRHLRRTHLIPTDEHALRAVARSMGFDTGAELVERWRASTRRVLRLHRRLFYSPLLEAVARIPTEEVRLTSQAAQTRLRALGYLDPAAALRHLEALTQGLSRKAEIQRQLLPAMLGWFAEGPNPDHGLLAFRQVSEALGTTSWYLRALRDGDAVAENLARILASSRFAVDLLLREPQEVRLLAEPDGIEPRPYEEIANQMASVASRQPDAERKVTAIRAVRRRELLRLAMGDLLGVIDSATLGSALSRLTSATVDAALTVIAEETPLTPPLALLALGSWGGGEMSYGSDADALVILADTDDPEASRAAASVVTRLRELLSRAGPDPGLAVDLDLRPEGKGGPMVRTLSSHLAYYAKWAEPWEGQALLRASHGAGDSDLTRQLLDATTGLRHPEGGLDARRFNQIRRLKARMEAERPRSSDPRRDIKLGPGGLSDVEWTVQSIQMRHGAEIPELRVPGTRDALSAAERAGLIGERDAHALLDAWELAYRLRNAITLARGRPSDLVPTDVREIGPIAGLLGYPRGESSHLLEEHQRRARRARQVMDAVFWEASG